ncbi:MAG: restriction endonuclease [Chloroflexi bacterium]|nr:restriction endonuclease [Chloroflexota bacterium]MDA1270962.1 restriction endonuclease [Chloroflexota bacterium]PKB59009.1 MAG: restriction endonuclease [SAR202 cluster bacterium Casp-Chloro-G2]
MAIPDYQTIMLPLLRLLSDGQEHQARTTIEQLAEEFSLTNEDRDELLPSGVQSVFNNRVGWARTYLKNAGLIDSPKRGISKITQSGINLLSEGHQQINVSLLRRFPEFRAFQSRRRTPDIQLADTELESVETPEDSLATAYRILRANLESEILQLVKESTPAFFERLVIDLLVKMGYGGSREDAGRAIGRSGDEGIDGVINEDRLGLDVIYLQAKRWDTTVGRPEIQRFAGALQGQRARKGVFITTSGFSREAQEYAANIDSRIILIDGARLARFMAEYNVAVSTIGIYEIKTIDDDYFLEG